MCANVTRATGLGSRPKHWGQSGPVPQPLEVRFFRKILCDLRTGCWFWTAGLGEFGYGQFPLTAKHKVRAHRFSWEMVNGPIPKDLWVLHHCDVNWPVGDLTYRRCVRPDHLFVGTPKENTADMIAKGRARFRGWRNHSFTTPVPAGPA